MEAPSDKWSAWLLKRRDGNDLKERTRALSYLKPIRDRVLDGAAIASGATVLDVGCGDGLLAFAALDHTGPSGQVIFTDISPPLLEVCQTIAKQSDIASQCSFLQAKASDLTSIPTAFVDAVVLRSVLIYEENKTEAFREFHRVLRPQGRLSLFEPINSFKLGKRETSFYGHEIPEISGLVEKVMNAYNESAPISMMNFDERDLFRFAFDTGFSEISLTYEASVKQTPPIPSWDVLLQSAPNPETSTLDEMLTQVLTPEEKTLFISTLRPRVEKNKGKQIRAVAYLRARKN